MKRKKCAVGGDLQSPNGLDMLSMGLSLVPGWGQIASPAMGLISGLVKKQQAEKELRNTVITGTPGNFVKGGPVTPPYTPVVTSPQVSMKTIEAKQVLQVLDQLPIVKASTGEVSSKSKSKSRFVEKAYGGSLDRNLSSTTFQVQGNSQETDGNNYNYKGSPVSLDHNEVVDTQKDFVYSDIVINPLTNKSFAKDAEKLQRATGKAEKQVAMNSSSESKNTVKYHNQMKDSLAGLQELIKLGSNEMKQQKQAFVKGGPLPWTDFNVSDFQNWYNQIPGATPLAADGKWGPMTEKAYGDVSYDYMNYTGKNKVDAIGNMSVPNYTTGTSTEVNPVNGMVLPSSVGNTQPISPRMGVVNTLPFKKLNLVPNEPYKEPGMLDTPVPFEDRSYTAVDPNAKNVLPTISGVPNPVAGARTSGNSFMPSGRGQIGDSLQGMEVLSKFFETMQPAEVQKPYVDNTQITKQSYDARPALAQNDRNYQNSVSSLSTPSINLRRALTNNMYASKLNADQQTITQYDGMNKQARTQYEGAVSNRIRYNNQQEFAADDANSRNRAAKDQAIQNAFTSLGNFGEAVNRKDQAYSSLALLKELYPDVYDRIINQYNTKTTVKIK